MPDTLARLFRHAVSYDKPDMILTKAGGTYKPIAASEVYRRVGRLQFALKAAGVAAGDRCALLSENRWEWAVSDFAMMTAGIVSVPIYPTLPAEQIQHLIEHSGSRAIFLSTEDQLKKILSVWDRLPGLEGVVIFDAFETDDPRITTLRDLIGDDPLTAAERDEFESSISSVQPDDLASIIYTSGTTGAPKGVMLTHANFGSNVRDNGLDIGLEDTGLSFLPLSHVAERMADYAFFYDGATLAYAESIDAVPKNLMEVRPTVAVGVPRFFEKVHDRVQASVSAASPFKRRLFHWAIEVGKATAPYRLKHEAIPLGLRLKSSLADRLVFGKLRGRLGGRIRYFISGAAPLPRHIAEFFFAVGVTICEGYGLTETSPLVALNTPENLRFGTVGKLIKNVQVKIAPDGEILVRGPNIMRGYYKDDEQTRQVIVDGWFHTGDIGKLDDDGYLSITDRKKDLFKTSGGKYITPQPIENQIKTSVYVSSVVVIAQGRKFPSALIVPDFDKLQEYALQQGIQAKDRPTLVRHTAIISLIESEVGVACKGFAPYEQVKKVAVLEEEFSLEKGEITPTMKIRRSEVERRHSHRIEEIYSA
ncbi:MAG TPA: long-chain fatty acid--CoA ligase [Bryobacterales bacterium]|nr:long-chain fatty acid--CoA ligase [Bryobacterales bacterium]